MKPISSAINLPTIGQAREKPESTGTEVSIPGSATNRSSVDAMDPRSSLKTDSRLHQLLPPTVAIWLGSDGNTRALVSQWELNGYPSRAILEEALALVETAMQPAPMATLYDQLAQLRILTKAKDHGEEEATISDRLTAERLTQFPGDVAISSIQELIDHSIFHPAYAEIHQICMARNLYRTRLRHCFMIGLTKATHDPV